MPSGLITDHTSPPDPMQGKTLDQTLREALQPVPNPHSDSGIAQLNRIRESLRLIAANSTAVGLPQVRMGAMAEGLGLMACGGASWPGQKSILQMLARSPPSLVLTAQPHLEHRRWPSRCHPVCSLSALETAAPGPHAAVRAGRHRL